METKHETNRGSVWLEDDQVLNKGGKMRHILLIKRGLASCSSAALWQSDRLELNTQNTGGHEEQPTGFFHCNHEEVRERVKSSRPPHSQLRHVYCMYACVYRSSCSVCCPTLCLKAQTVQQHFAIKSIFIPE